MHLPDIDGLDLLRHLKARPGDLDIPVIVVSADATAQQVDAALDAGAVRYLTKPVDVNEFLATVDDLLDPHGHRLQLISERYYLPVIGLGHIGPIAHGLSTLTLRVLICAEPNRPEGSDFAMNAIPTNCPCPPRSRGRWCRPLGNLDAYISAVNRLPMLTPEEEIELRAPPARPRRPRGRRAAGAVAPAPGGLGLAPVPGLRPAARRPDPGRQHRPDEGGQALRPGPGRAPGELRDALDQGRDPRVHPEELAHGQGRHDQGAAQAVLQPALDEAEPEGRRRPTATRTAAR